MTKRALFQRLNSAHAEAVRLAELRTDDKAMYAYYIGQARGLASAIEFVKEAK